MHLICSLFHLVMITIGSSQSFDKLSTDSLDYCSVQSSNSMQNVIQLYKNQYRKSYRSNSEEAKRRRCIADKIEELKKSCFIRKRMRIDRKPMYSLTLNILADLTPEEFHRMLGYVPPHQFPMVERRRRRRSLPSLYSNTTDISLLPVEIDWRSSNSVSPVQMQGSCGSCWAFAALGAIESHYFLKVSNKSQTILSVQNLVDCSGDQGNQGCDGGSMENAYNYIVSNTGVNLALTYPYVGYQNTQCLFGRTDTTAKSSPISGWSMIDPYNEQALLQAVAMVGPIAAAIDASALEFQLYKSGVLCHLSCSKSEVNHGVLIVGYKTIDSIPVWIVKNSWSAKWGMSGYCYVCRNTNFCGIATTANFPVLANTV